MSKTEKNDFYPIRVLFEWKWHAVLKWCKHDFLGFESAENYFERHKPKNLNFIRFGYYLSENDIYLKNDESMLF